MVEEQIAGIVAGLTLQSLAFFPSLSYIKDVRSQSVTVRSDSTTPPAGKSSLGQREPMRSHQNWAIQMLLGVPGSGLLPEKWRTVRGNPSSGIGRARFFGVAALLARF